MENERGRQEVLMALQGVGRLGIMMDPVFKLTAAGTILLIQHFARMYKEGLLNRREFQNFQEFAKLTEGNYQMLYFVWDFFIHYYIRRWHIFRCT